MFGHAANRSVVAGATWVSGGVPGLWALSHGGISPPIPFVFLRKIDQFNFTQSDCSLSFPLPNHQPAQHLSSSLSRLRLQRISIYDGDHQLDFHNLLEGISENGDGRFSAYLSRYKQGQTVFICVRVSSGVALVFSVYISVVFFRRLYRALESFAYLDCLGKVFPGGNLVPGFGATKTRGRGEGHAIRNFSSRARKVMSRRMWEKCITSEKRNSFIKRSTLLPPAFVADAAGNKISSWEKRLKATRVGERSRCPV
jgi:hypothetical protein